MLQLPLLGHMYAPVFPPYQPPPHTKLDIAFQDAHMIIVDKPSGLLTVPGRGPEKADCLLSRVHVSHPSALIVHRLDMETSGLVILALEADTHRALSKLFEQRAVGKTYIARVAGQMQMPSGEIDLPLMKDWPNRPLQKVDMDAGKPSLTRWRVLEEDAMSTRLELTPLTGRSHQLRVHLNAIGHPILGDALYGTEASRAGAARLQLHASGLAFVHPISGDPVRLGSLAPF